MTNDDPNPDRLFVPTYLVVYLPLTYVERAAFYSDLNSCHHYMNGDFSSLDLENWLHKPAQARDTFCALFTSCSPQEFGCLPGFQIGSQRVLIVHPLWNRDNSIGLLADAIATVALDTQIRYLDPFNR